METIIIICCVITVVFLFLIADNTKNKTIIFRGSYYIKGEYETSFEIPTKNILYITPAEDESAYKWVIVLVSKKFIYTDKKINIT